MNPVKAYLAKIGARGGAAGTGAAKARATAADAANARWAAYRAAQAKKKPTAAKGQKPRA